MIKKLLPFTLLALFFIFSGCKKKDDDDDNNPPPAGPTQVWDNVIVADYTTLVLDATQSDFANGVYVFYYYGNESNPLQTGDVVVGEEGDGFIRRITSVTNNGIVYTCQTEQANMEDVFKTGTFSFYGNMDDMTPGKKEAVQAGFSYSMGNLVLYNQGPLKVEVLSGNISMEPTFYFDFGFNENGITKFQCQQYTEAYAANAQMKITATQAITPLTKSDVLASYTKHITFNVPVGQIVIPVKIRIDMKWIADYSVNIASAYTGTANFGTSGSYNVGVMYNNSQWQSIYELNNTPVFNYTQSGTVSTTFNYAWRPEITVKLYGVVGPVANILAPTAAIKGTVASPALDWDLKAEGWLKTTLGADVSILGNTLASFGPAVFETEKLIYRKPDKIERTSGDNQTGEPNQPLPQPIKVRVLDSQGAPQKDVPVYFAVTSGGGSISPTSILTDANGYAEASWTLGQQQVGIQYCTANAKYGDGTPVNYAPTEFAAFAGIAADFSASETNIDEGDAVNFTDQSSGNPDTWQWSFPGGSPSSSTAQNPSGITYNNAGTYDVSLTVSNGTGNNTETKYGYITVNDTTNGCDGSSSFTDPRDGQTYSIVQIGNQCWFAENLRYAGSIAHPDNAGWAAIYNNGSTTAAWGNYADNPANDTIYGKIYNWYAAQSVTLCPNGWHTPSIAEWQVLIDYLGGVDVAGGAMKATTSWDTNEGATNSSGFTALGGGERSINGIYSNIGFYTQFWSSTEYNINYAGAITLNHGTPHVGITNPSLGVLKAYGFYCRCVRD
ncbi:MAG: hypothetical protein POELPBGB_00397 [Bacteroidia bacterium]|nr:hypothetical protein [Bacteroidia bacterium]